MKSDTGQSRGGRQRWIVGIFATLVIAATVMLARWTGRPMLARGPYLQSATPTGIVVRWRTSRHAQSVLRYGSQPDALSQTVRRVRRSAEHSVHLTGLEPGTRYYYAVGSGERLLAGADDSHFFVTPPTSGTRQTTRVWVLGDSGKGNVRSRAVRDSYYEFTAARHTDLWLMLGDNAYERGTHADYQRAVFDTYPGMLRKSVLWPSVGNHDVYTGDSSAEAGAYFDVFTLPRMGEAGGLASGTEAYYSFDHANIHFIALDSSDSDRGPEGRMVTWLRRDLEATRQDWIVAFWHHPPYSDGSHRSDTEIELVEMRQNAVPILEAHGADLVICGHSHAYERSFLLHGHYGVAETLTTAAAIDRGNGREDGDGVYRKPRRRGPGQGTVYVVAGNAAYVSPKGELKHPVMLYSMRALGSVVLDVGGLRLDYTFLDNQGERRDHFTMVKE